jgi:CelD/BcsL family acetyltransferase involved in cellulose biosynthesis
MSLEVNQETLDSIFAYYNDPESDLTWPSPYILPQWLRVWLEAFGQEYETLLLSFRQEEKLIGIAPLIRKGNQARLAGSPDVCDYLDFITVSGKEREFFSALLPALQERGIEQLSLYAQRPDAAVFKGLYLPLNHNPGYHSRFALEDESYEMPLPSTWEEYLSGLNKKQRHEVRRKLRRVQDEAGDYQYRVLEEAGEVKDFLPHFFDLFLQNPEKKDFFTGIMEQFFLSLVDTTADSGLARFGLLEIEGRLAAAILYFDYQGRVYLYNSGYHNDYGDVSAGLISKILSIRESIERGRKVFDFLKGREVYKGRLGGNPIPIYSVIITIQRG